MIRAMLFLARQFKTGMVKKQYVAIVHGQVKGDEGEIDLSIVRHPKKRKQMSVTHSGGRRALTLWQKAEVFAQLLFAAAGLHKDGADPPDPGASFPHRSPRCGRSGLRIRPELVEKASALQKGFATSH